MRVSWVSSWQMLSTQAHPGGSFAPDPKEASPISAPEEMPLRATMIEMIFTWREAIVFSRSLVNYLFSRGDATESDNDREEVHSKRGHCLFSFFCVNYLVVLQDKCLSRGHNIKETIILKRYLDSSKHWQYLKVSRYLNISIDYIQVTVSLIAAI